MEPVEQAALAEPVEQAALVEQEVPPEQASTRELREVVAPGERP